MSREESPHITSLRNQDKLKKLATERFRVANDTFEKYKAEPPTQDIETVVAAAEARERLANPRIGDMIKGRGIFLGIWEPRDNQGNSLSKRFNVFAAPQDLPLFFTYDEACEHVGKLKNWHGFDGMGYPEDTELYQALKDDTYTGGWIIPTIDMMRGRDFRGNKTMPGPIFDYKDAGAFKGTFRFPANDARQDHFYWSSTKENRHMLVAVTTGGFDRKWPDMGSFSCRPVRLEPKL